jgi:hypothetical protein
MAVFEMAMPIVVVVVAIVTHANADIADVNADGRARSSD